MKSLVPVVIAFAVAGAVLAQPGPAGAFTLRRHEVRLVENRQGDKRYRYDDRVPAGEAKALLEHFSRLADDPVPSIYAVPGAKDYYVVSSWDNRSTGADFGRRLYLLRKGKEGYEETGRSRGAGDSYILRPVFFTGRGRILVLAELGTEYSWGLMAFEITGNRLVELGPLEAAVEGEWDAVDPTPFAVVKLVKGRWRVEFSRDLVLDPGGLTERRIVRKGNLPIVFEHDGKAFFPKAGTFSAAAGDGKESAP